ncbi:thiopeptide-type bacteriocin biosynthesis protein [Streptomyces sp. NPDC008313]|uniref:thiopeptide-type bacteriocin biosynthesis protein n=1 Tax=Streptomyces TaxID=1883 RepID=UPI0029A122D3|nr:thiopeptide-type bacteriocin biosynthesis protein [Streptomyces europaeiscabiei]MDX3777506.1 thiopeptide-type bacteriocin biosynthesis protein [Streptomyces europaeiscabiei]
MDLPASSTIEQAVLAALTGTPLAEAASRSQTSPEQLVKAIARYRDAGRAALGVGLEPSGWLQASIEFTDYSTAERAFHTYLLPLLQQAMDSRSIACWWFIRKRPCWRLRALPGPRPGPDDLSRQIRELLDTAVSGGGVEHWWPSPYEPETSAFGGPFGMDIAHDLFHTDSLGVLDYLYSTGKDGDGGGLLDAKATSLLLISLFLRAAGQEWSEQGDIWARVEVARPLPVDIPLDRVTAMTPVLHRLLTIDATPFLTAKGPLAPVANWFTGMEHGGRVLGHAGREGQLSLGTRGVLARHILFHWNRMGFTARQQAIWARAARETILGN